MGVVRLISRIIPNLIVIIFSSGLGYISIFYCLPYVLSVSSYPFLYYLMAALVIVFYIMWAWCWLYAGTTDPGRTEDDLRARGVLSRIQHGDIPPCLQHLPICPICSLPKPASSHHCTTCGACHLRMDHHCGVTGQCVADKNMKSFILSFCYAFLYGVSMSVIDLSSFRSHPHIDVICLIGTIYSILIGTMLLGFGISFVISGTKGVGTIDKLSKREGRRISYKKYFDSFGSNWFERMVPIQHGTTFLAWPGVEWDMRFELP